MTLYASALDMLEAEARKQSPPLAAESISPSRAIGRVLAESLQSPVAPPRFDTSAMDGYAVSSKTTQLVSPHRPLLLEVCGTIAAGDEPSSLNYSHVSTAFEPCLEIMTGGIFPHQTISRRNLDACVKIEETTLVVDATAKHRKLIRITKPVAPNAHRRFAGADIKEGQVLLEAGVVLRPHHLLVLASETASKATVHLAPKVGTNLALLNGIQHLMFQEGWVNTDYVEKHVVGLKQLEDTVCNYTPQVVQDITGVPADLLRKAAAIIGTTDSLLSTALQGVYQSNQATASACQINNINLLRGLIGKPGSGVLQKNGQPTAQNNREAGGDGEFPGFRNHLNLDHMKELAELWNIDAIQVPHWNEPTHVQNLLNFMEGGTIQMLWISGTNPLVSLPNPPRVRKILTSPDLLVICQDIYMTETAAIADVVLPAAQWGEKTGCFTNVDRTFHLSHKAVDPPGEAKSDLDIFLDYGRRMGFQDRDGKCLFPYDIPQEVFEA